MDRSGYRVLLSLFFRFSRGVFSTCCLLATLFAVSPQEKTGKASGSGIDLKAESEAVVVDLIVRDEKGRPVNDLSTEEIEVFENGEEQRIISFFSAAGGLLTAETDDVGQAPDASLAAIQAGVPLNPRSLPGMRLPDLLLLVFDELDLDSGRRAREAALQLASSLGESGWACVLKVNRALVPLTPFSQDRETLFSAIERATGGASTPSQPLTARLQVETDRYLDMVETYRSSQGALGGLTAQASSEVAEIKLQEMLVNMLRFQESGQKDQRGGATLHSLMALVKATAALQGRKSLLYFSQALPVTSNLDGLFEGVIDMANRHNVSIYAFDAGGLKTERPLEQSGIALRQAGDLGRLQQQTLSFFSTVDEMKLTDITYDTLGMDYQGLLHEMSERTGGFATVNSNNLGKGLDRVLQDIASRYELAYVPSRQTYDGSYRKIEVKVARSGVEVQARDGYFAVPPTTRFDVLPFEIPLLARLNQNGADDRQVAVEVAALRFQRTASQRRAELVMEFPLGHLAFEVENGSFKGHFSSLMLLKDASGEIVEKFSQDYPLRGPLDNLEPLRKGQVILMHPVSLPPGRYMLQAVVSGQPDGRVGTASTEVEISEPPAGLELSSITLIRQSKPYVEVEDSTGDPLRFQDSKIVPNVSGQLDRQTDPNLLFFLNIYPDLNAVRPELNLEFLEDRKNDKGKLLASMKSALPSVDERGRISFVYGFPVAAYQPGRYVLRAEVVQGETRAEEISRVILK